MPLRRSLLLYLVLLLLGNMLWPYLRQMGLARLPGDATVVFQGDTFHLPFMTSLIIASVISLVWRLLDPTSE